MDSYGPRRGPRPMFWLVPLLIGIVLGALIFGGPRGPHLYGGWGGFGYRETVPAPQAPQAAQPVQPAQPQAAPPAPRFDAAGGWGRHRGFDRGRHDGGFFPFGGFRLLIPLLLIGAGAWLLSGRGRRPGSWGGPQQGSQPGPQGTPPTAPHAQPGAPPAAGPYTPPQPGPQPEPPTTGETRIL